MELKNVLVPTWKLATPWIAKSEPGVEVPIPTEPFLSTMNDVPVDEPMTNWGTPAVELMDSLANGVEVPSPKRVLVSSQKKEDVELACVSL